MEIYADTDCTRGIDGNKNCNLRTVLGNFGFGGVSHAYFVIITINQGTRHPVTN